MKKEWNRPRALVQHFIANEYISNCGTQSKFVFDCNVQPGYIYKETNGEPGLQTSGDFYQQGGKWVWKGPDKQIGPGKVLKGCGYTHEAPMIDDFPKGYDYLPNGEVEDIRLWYDNTEGGQAGGGWHGTTNTDMNTWEVVKS